MLTMFCYFYRSPWFAGSLTDCRSLIDCILDLCHCLFNAFDVIKSKHLFLFVSIMNGQVIQNATNDHMVDFIIKFITRTYLVKSRLLLITKLVPDHVYNIPNQSN